MCVCGVYVEDSIFYILLLTGNEKHNIVGIGADIIHSVCRKTAQNADFAHTRSDKFTSNVLGRIMHLCSCL